MWVRERERGRERGREREMGEVGRVFVQVVMCVLHLHDKGE
jgi:hypothetical protein